MDGAAKKTGGGEGEARPGRVVIVAGPTASGKSGLAAELAERLGGFVVNADSRQVYAELNIGVAKPTLTERGRATHYLVGHRALSDLCSAGAWAREARAVIEAGFAERRREGTATPVAVVAGGTGFYRSALLAGMPEMPPVAPEITDAYQARLDAGELLALQEELAEKDPAYFAVVDRANGARLVRALAVIEAAGGASFTELRARPREPLPYPVARVILGPGTVKLFPSIDARVDEMIEAGLEGEARGLYPRRHLRALQTLGYQEWWPYFEGKLTREEVVTQIKQSTRHYARRQLTWDRKLAGVRLQQPDPAKVMEYLYGLWPELKVKL